jgi:hypothetical protein
MVIPRSWKDADGAAAAREFLAHPSPRRAPIRDLMRALLSRDPFDRRCAADLARRISTREPGILRKYADVLIDLAAGSPLAEWQARGHVTLAAALNATTSAQRRRLIIPVRAMLDDERNALRAIALQAFAILAAAEPPLRDECLALLEHARREGTAAMRARARNVLPLLMAAEKTKR